MACKKKKKQKKKTGFMHYCSRSAAVCRRIEDVPGRCHTTMLSEERSAKGESAVSFTCFTCRGQQALYSDWIGKPRLLFGRNCYLASKSPVLRVSPRPPPAITHPAPYSTYIFQSEPNSTAAAPLTARGDSFLAAPPPLGPTTRSPLPSHFQPVGV